MIAVVSAVQNPHIVVGPRFEWKSPWCVRVPRTRWWQPRPCLRQFWMRKRNLQHECKWVGVHVSKKKRGCMHGLLFLQFKILILLLDQGSNEKVRDVFGFLGRDDKRPCLRQFWMRKRNLQHECKWVGVHVSKKKRGCVNTPLYVRANAWLRSSKDEHCRIILSLELGFLLNALESLTEELHRLVYIYQFMTWRRLKKKTVI
jgi:hypothetical protein